MSDDAQGHRPSRSTKTRWSVFEPHGHEELHGDEPGAGSPTGSRATADDDALDPLLVAVAGELRRPVTLDAALDARIMALVAGEPRPSREIVAASVVSAGGAAPKAEGASLQVTELAAHRAWRWLRRPRVVRVTPLGGLAAVAGLAALLLVAVRLGGVNGAAAGSIATAPSATVASLAADSTQVVQFVLVAPGAQSVALVGDFNDWEAGATPLRAVSAGQVWSVEVPLVAGRHRYAFVVDDDRWVADPSAPRAPGDDFGAPSSVVTVVERRS